MRLFKLASEINVGKDTIVDFLRAKGFDVEGKASTKLTEDQIDIVLENFEKEHAAAEKLRRSLPTMRKKTQTVEAQSENPTPEPSTAPAPQEQQPVVAPSPVAHTEAEPSAATTPAPPVAVVEQKEEPVAAPPPQTAQVGTVIDLKGLESGRNRGNRGQKEKNSRNEQRGSGKSASQPTSHKDKVSPPAPPQAKKETPSRREEQKPAPSIKAQTPPTAGGTRREALPGSSPTAGGARREALPGSSPTAGGARREAVAPAVAKDVQTAPPKQAAHQAAKPATSPSSVEQKAAHQQHPERRPAERTSTAGAESDTRREKQQDRQPPFSQRPPRDEREQKSAMPPRDSRNMPPKSAIPPDVAKGDDEGDSEARRRRKKKRKFGEIEYQVGEAPSLPGLTILGKIDLTSVGAAPDKGKKDRTKEKDKGRPKQEGQPRSPQPNKLQGKDQKKKVKGAEVTKVLASADAIKEAGKKNLKKRGKRDKRDKVSSEAVDQAIKKTLTAMDDTSPSSRTRARQRRRLERAEENLRQQEFEREQSQILKVTEFITVSELATLLEAQPNEVILKCMGLGLMVSINQRLDADTITLIADDYGRPVEFEKEYTMDVIEDEEDPEETLVSRPPIVTVMGHVDHGKTSLLDYIRRANVVAGEAGGITQHIGAYSVRMPHDLSKTITFLDTPGHQAFTAMRARGAQVTDIVILVVAADDNIMPQTLEAISHAQAANVPIIVAINKIDKPDANPERIKQQLADRGLLVEEWGGKYQSVEISAKKGINIDTLLEKVLLEAELLDLKARPDRRARGVVIESQIDKGKGAISTIIVQKGTLKVGDPFIAGVYSGRVRAMFDERGHKIDIVHPSGPAQIIGFDGVPTAGDPFVVTASESEAKEVATRRQQIKREQEFKQVRHVTLDDIANQIKSGGVQDLRIVLKADTDGSLEALTDSLEKLSTQEVRVSVIHRAVGAISESDVMLAAASDAIIIGFHVRPSLQAKKLAENEHVDIRIYRIIYDCINEIKSALEGMLAPETKEEVAGTAEVRDIFRISKVGTIAGCYILEGKINRNDTVRLVRDGFEIFTGKISSLRRHKDDVREVDHNYECGISLEGYNDIKVGDFIEAVKIIEIKRTLS